MWEHVRAFVASFLLSEQRGWNVHVRSKRQCPHANFGLHLISKQEATKEKSLKNASHIQKATPLHTWNKYILIYITVSLSCAIRHTRISYIRVISETRKSSVCTETLCTSLQNLLQCLVKQSTFGPLLFDTNRINTWTVMGPVKKSCFTKDDHEGIVGRHVSKRTPQNPLYWQKETKTLNATIPSVWKSPCREPLITSHTTCCAGNWRVPRVLWLNTTAASASDTLSHWLPPGLTWRYSAPGIWILLKPLKHTEREEGHLVVFKTALCLLRCLDQDLPLHCTMPFPSHAASLPG